MGTCWSTISSGRKSKQHPRAQIVRAGSDAVSKSDDARGNSYLISNYRDRSRTHEDISSFFSFDKDDSRLVSCTSIDLAAPPTVPPGTDGLHEPHHRPRRVLKCGRTGEFYGYRDRIPSHIDIGEHDDNYWWSAANLGRTTIAHDMGDSPLVLSRPIKVTVVPSSFFASHRDIEVFPEYLSLCRTLRTSTSQELASPPGGSVTSAPSTPSRTTRLIIFKLKMGEQVMVSLNEVIDETNFDLIFNEANRDDLLHKKFKFILSPINSPLPIPAKKPKDAETIGSYFGMDNVDFYVDDSFGEVKVASILVNIYAKWVIRKFLPLVTSSMGRICDFILLSSDDRVVYADFRLLATEVSQALIKGNAPPPSNKQKAA